MSQLSRANPVRSRLRAACVLVGIAAVALAAAAPAAASGGRTTARLHPARPSAVAQPAGLTGRVHYAINKPLCARAASPTAFTCHALRRVTVKAGTPGSYAYEVPAYTHGPAGGLTPADLAKAYGYNPALHRTGQTVALVNWYDDPHAHADLDRFDKHYGLPKETAKSFRKVNSSGRASKYPKPDRGSAGETSLDIETVRAVCHTCRILLVEASAPTISALAKAEDTAARLGATEISNSFGAAEHRIPARLRKAFDHPGVVITASTGDDGWYDWDAVNARVRSPGRASYPSTDPHVIAVGGTSLQLNADGTRAAETVWNSNGASDTTGEPRGPLGASGGGCSKYLGAGAWQRKHPGYRAAGCAGKRLAADVSADADPATGFDVINTFHERGLSKWETVGGTSLSSPLVAAMFALAGGAHGSAYPAATAYLNATYRPAHLYDVTQGGNSFCGGDDTTTCSQTIASETDPPTNNPNGFGGVTDCSFPRGGKAVTTAPPKLSECNATTGYDGPSGVGTPKGLAFFHPTAARLSIKHHKHLKAHHRVAFSATMLARIKGLHRTSFTWKFGDGAGSGGNGTLGTHHTYKKKGTYRVTLRVTDTSGQITVAHSTVKVR